MAGYDYWSSIGFKIPRDSSISGIAITIDSAKLFMLPINLKDLSLRVILQSVFRQEEQKVVPYFM